MGLKTDIFNAFIKSMGGPDDLAPEQLDTVEVLSYDLTEAFKTFLTKQTWEITDMKAFVELEDFRYEEPVCVDVEPNTLAGPYSPVISAVKSISGVNLATPIKAAAKGVSQCGAETQPFDLDVDGGLKATGHAYVGSSNSTPILQDEYDTNGDNEGWNQFSQVKIKEFEEDE